MVCHYFFLPKFKMSIVLVLLKARQGSYILTNFSISDDSNAAKV